MNGTVDPDETVTTEGGDLDPREAAELLDHAMRQARRRFQPNPPLLSVFRAIVVLAAFGGIWLSVRNQHPYSGPNGWAMILAYVLVGAVVGLTAWTTKRAASGVSGPSQRARNGGMVVLLIAWVAVYAFMAALLHAGASHAIVYGIYPATAPLMILGLAAAASAAAREDWPMLYSSLAVAVVATAAAFGGPVNAWLIMAIGLFTAMLGSAAITIWQQRRSVIRP